MENVEGTKPIFVNRKPAKMFGFTEHSYYLSVEDKLFTVSRSTMGAAEGAHIFDLEIPEEEAEDISN